MNVYGGTCPMCCGDLDDDGTDAAVCLFCRQMVEASPSTARRMLDAIPLRVSTAYDAPANGQQLRPSRVGPEITPSSPSPGGFEIWRR